MRKIRVLFISHSDPGKGGAPKSLIELIINLRNNFNVEPIVCVHSEDAVYKFCKKNEIECYVTKHSDIWTGGVKKISSWINIPKFRKKLFKNDKRAYELLSQKIDLSSIDIIHSNVSVVNLGMYIYKKTGIPHIMHLREDADVLNQMVYTINPIKNMNKYVTRFIAISNFVKIKWKKRGLSGDKIDLVYNGLKLPNKCPRKILNKPIIKIVMVGSIIKSKGQLDVLKALSNLNVKYRNKVQLDILGSGNKRYIKRLNQFIEKNNLENINLLGYQKDISSKLKNYDVAIMASRGEAFGRVTVEYMANGLVVIGNEAGANPEIIRDNETGLIYERNNINSLTKKLIYVIEYPEKANKLSAAGQDEVYAKFTTNINAKNVYNEYIELIK